MDEQQQTDPAMESAPQSNAPARAPSAQPGSTKSRKKPAVLLLAALLLLGAIAAVFALTKPLSHKEIFYAAVDNQLQTTTLKQGWEFSGGEFTGTLTSSSDFSEPRTPKTSASFTLSSAETADSPEVTIAAEFVALSSEEAYAKYSQYRFRVADQEINLDALLNKWIKVDLENPTDLASSILSGVNTPLGEFITGSFDTGVRRDILNQIQQKKLFTITSSTNTEEEGKKTVRYELAHNAKEILALNNDIAYRLGIKSMPFSEEDLTQSSTIWVDRDSNRLVKVVTVDDGDTHTLRVSGVGEPVSVTKPENALSSEEFNALMEEALVNIFGPLLEPVYEQT